MGSPGIERDAWGVPQLRAGDPDALSWLQGYAAAADRGAQLRVERLRSEGRLAEELGPAEVPWDRFARRARLDDTARRCFARLRPPTRRWVQSYVDGVNAHPGTAEPWRPWTPLGVFLVQHILFGTFPGKLWNAHAGDLAPMFRPEAGSGSNAWAAPGTIAGDPHRLLELPGIYQQVRLTCPEFDAAGLAFPGVPGLPHFGHAGRVAWAVTNAMADYQDLYLERLRVAGGGLEVRDGDGWVPAARHVERIAVRGGEPVEVEVVETPRGPVIDPDRGLALRVPARVEGALGFDALLPMLRARTAAEVADALADWVEPVNSYLVADSTGAVVSLTAGLVPERHERNRRVPVPGWEPRYTWGGYLPMPRSEVSGPVVNANDRRPDVAPLGDGFAPAHRARRIAALLAGGAPAAAVHLDAHVARPVLGPLLERLGGLGPGAAALRDRLLAWDGRMAADSADAGAFAAWRGELARRIAEVPELAALHEPHGLDELFAPWTSPLARIGLALDGVVTALGPAADGPAAAALAAVAAGPDPGVWGDRHLLHPVQAAPDPVVLARVRAAARLSGDNDAVLATSSTPGVTDACWRGPVARYVWDLTDPAASRWIVPFGAAGDPADPHFADQLPLWAAGELIPVFPEGPS